jgi:hypothetical protein
MRYPKSQSLEIVLQTASGRPTDSVRSRNLSLRPPTIERGISGCTRTKSGFHLHSWNKDHKPSAQDQLTRPSLSYICLIFASGLIPQFICLTHLVQPTNGSYIHCWSTFEPCYMPQRSILRLWKDFLQHKFHLSPINNNGRRFNNQRATNIPNDMRKLSEKWLGN